MALRRSRPAGGSWLRTGPEPAVRQLPVVEEILPDRIILRARLPGFTFDQIDVQATQHDVVIRTNRPLSSLPTQPGAEETYPGNWYRRIRLPHAVRPDLATITFANGELTICLPRVTSGESIIRRLPGAEVFEHPEIPLRTSADLAEPSPGPHDTVFKP